MDVFDIWETCYYFSHLNTPLYFDFDIFKKSFLFKQRPSLLTNTPNADHKQSNIKKISKITKKRLLKKQSRAFDPSRSTFDPSRRCRSDMFWFFPIAVLIWVQESKTFTFCLLRIKVFHRLAYDHLVQWSKRFQTAKVFLVPWCRKPISMNHHKNSDLFIIFSETWYFPKSKIAYCLKIITRLS